MYFLYRIICKLQVSLDLFLTKHSLVKGSGVRSLEILWMPYSNKISEIVWSSLVGLKSIQNMRADVLGRKMYRCVCINIIYIYICKNSINIFPLKNYPNLHKTINKSSGSGGGGSHHRLVKAHPIWCKSQWQCYALLCYIFRFHAGQFPSICWYKTTKLILGRAPQWPHQKKNLCEVKANQFLRFVGLFLFVQVLRQSFG